MKLPRHYTVSLDSTVHQCIRTKDIWWPWKCGARYGYTDQYMYRTEYNKVN